MFIMNNAPCILLLHGRRQYQNLLVTSPKNLPLQKMFRKLCNILPICFIFFLHACVPASKIENEWTAPAQKTDSTKVFQKILFVALLKDDATRRIAEDKLVAEVKGRGVASYGYRKGLATRS